jgi:hypothetical protein
MNLFENNFQTSTNTITNTIQYNYYSNLRIQNCLLKQIQILEEIKIVWQSVQSQTNTATMFYNFGQTIFDP